MAESPTTQSVRCMLIPLQDKLFLIPSTMVTEVSALSPPSEAATSTWLENGVWRAAPLDIANIDYLYAGEAGRAARSTYMCVVKGLYQTDSFDIYGIACAGPPRQQMIEIEMLEKAGNSTLSWVFGEIVFEEKPTIIPDVAALEQLIVDAKS